MQTHQPPQEQAFEFTGNGWEYFKIWIVNLMLSILTLGIYSAWAKVRRLQYFYRNTRLADASFEYHGLPMSILKGRLIAFGLLLIYYAAGAISPVLAIIAFLLIATILPWMIVRSLRFKLRNSSYRGLRFSFSGSDAAAYTVFLLFSFLSLLTLYGLAPFTHQRIKQYQHGNSQFGDTYFSFDATVGSFYGVYLRMLGMFFALGLSIPFLFFADLKIIAFILLPVAFLFISGYYAVRLPNLIWNGTGLGEHTFYSRLEIKPYVWIFFTNMLGIILTLGLFVPFAQIRMMRYKIENMGLMAQGDLAEFCAGQSQDANATGEETAEMFDLDISL